jgi:AbiU2
MSRKETVMESVPGRASGEELFKKAQMITESLVQDLKIAIENDATMAAGNAAVAPLHGLSWYGARSYNAIRRALTMDLAQALGRIFDEGKDVASISKLVHLLRDKTCQVEIERRASQWTVGLAADDATTARRKIASAVHEYQLFQGSGRSELDALRAFRTDKLAHSLPGASPKPLPRFQDLSTLLKAAASIVAHIHTAILGAAWDPSDTSEVVAHEADEFWRHAVAEALSSLPK